MEHASWKSLAPQSAQFHYVVHIIRSEFWQNGKSFKFFDKGKGVDSVEIILVVSFIIDITFNFLYGIGTIYTYNEIK